MTDRDRALAFLRGQDRLLADRVEPLRYGEALLTASLPRVYDGNFIVVEHLRAGAGAEMVADDAERIMGGAGLGHRRVDVADDETATRLAPGLGRLGWDAQTFLLMTLRSAPSAATGTEEVAPADLAGLRAEAIRTYPWGSPDVVEQLLERDRRRAERTMVRAFAVRADRRLVSQALLFRDGSDVAQVENVETLERYRGRGYSRAVVTAAIHAAADASLIFLITDADDWPQELYRKLGFETAGRTTQFLRRVQPKPRMTSIGAATSKRIQCLSELGTNVTNLRVSADAWRPFQDDHPPLRLQTKGVVMPVWAWILLVGGFIGMIGAALICAFVYECTTTKFRNWEPLP